MSRLERIAAELGGLVFDGGRRALVPGPGHGPADRSVSLVETEEGRILIHCFSPRDDWRVVRRALADRGLLDLGGDDVCRSSGQRQTIIAAQPNDEQRAVRARRIWEESAPIEHTQAAAYLRRRAIAPHLIASEALRFHARMTSVDDRKRRPALVAAIHDPAGALQGVQVTLLAAHGAAKAAVPTPRRVIGRLMGGAVRLHPVAAELAVGEGVETMLSAAEALGLPAAAALTAGNLGAFSPPRGVERLVVAVDNDEAGYAAVDRLRERLSISITVALPPDGAEDWNAWACARA
jgi:phage/plasmid primase-like uncharacterized protein